MSVNCRGDHENAGYRKYVKVGVEKIEKKAVSSEEN
jgi:hypothetical protein